METRAKMTVIRNPARDDALFAARLRDLLHDCVASAACEEADRIAEAARLLCGAWRAGHVLPAPDAGAETIAALAKQGAGESAVLRLIGGEASFMLSRGGNGSCLATVVLPDGSEEMIAQGATLALALLAAHLSSLLADAERGDGPSAFFPEQASARLN